MIGFSVIGTCLAEMHSAVQMTCCCAPVKYLSKKLPLPTLNFFGQASKWGLRAANRMALSLAAGTLTSSAAQGS